VRVRIVVEPNSAPNYFGINRKCEDTKAETTSAVAVDAAVATVVAVGCVLLSHAAVRCCLLLLFLTV